MVLAFVWEGGPLTGKYAQSNRHPEIETPSVSMLRQSWSVSFTSEAWARLLAPPPGPITVDMGEPGLPIPVLVTSPVIRGWATHYGISYQGGVLGCGTGYYDTMNPDIVAVGPSRYKEWPCGTKLRICGPAGCILATRHDACPGCTGRVLDLSEEGNRRVCGVPAHTCRATIQVVKVPEKK
jgi:hypothetical protein